MDTLSWRFFFENDGLKIPLDGKRVFTNLENLNSQVTGTKWGLYGN